MKQLIPNKYIPLLTLGLGGLCLALRWLLYATAIDDRGLLESGHILNILLRFLVPAAGVVLAVAVLPLAGSNLYEDNFPASLPGAAGAFAAAACILLTALTADHTYPDMLSRIWTIAGIAAALCLGVTGFCRLQGRKPFFAFHALVCIFFALNLANRYRAWSGNPQAQDYLPQLFASILVMLFAYYQASFDAGIGRRRAQLFCGLAGCLLCLVSLAHAENPLLYLGCSAWCILNLCPMTPKKRRRRKPAIPSVEETDHEQQ